MIWHDMSWYDMIWSWYDMSWYDMIWSWCNMSWYDMIWYDMIWSWYGMIWSWYDMPTCSTNLSIICKCGATAGTAVFRASSLVVKLRAIEPSSRQDQPRMHVGVCMRKCNERDIYIYIYIYIERERKSPSTYSRVGC